MEKYTFDTDFSSLKPSETNKWLMNFGKMAMEAFDNKDNCAILLGNLLVMEEYVSTIREGLKSNGEELSHILKESMDLLWNYLNGNICLEYFNNFANNTYACVLYYNTGEDLTDEQKIFDEKYFAGIDFSGCEYQAIEWCSVLLIQVSKIESKKIKNEPIEEYEKFSFFEIDEMLNILEDASIEITETPCLSDRAIDLLKAEEIVHQTEFFRNIIKNIQNCFKTALNASQYKYLDLRREYQQYKIIPNEYAIQLLEY